MGEDRAGAFDKARQLQEADKADEALGLIKEFAADKENELSIREIETLSYILQEKITSASFDDKKDACYECIDLLEGMKIGKEPRFIMPYAEAIYECFSKINRSARDEERENVWCRAKEMYLEVFKAVRKAYKEKNNAERLEIYLSFAKLAKSYLDVADEDSLTICEEAAKEAKFSGRTGLSNDEWNEVKRAVDQINKHCADARTERKLLDEE